MFPIAAALPAGFWSRERLDEEWKPPSVREVALNQALSRDALKNPRLVQISERVAEGFGCKHTQMWPCLPVFPHSVIIPLLSFSFLSLPALFPPSSLLGAGDHISVGVG